MATSINENKKIVNAIEEDLEQLSSYDGDVAKRFFNFIKPYKKKAYLGVLSVITFTIFSTLLISLKVDYLNAEYLFEELEIDTSTKTEEDGLLPTNPFELVEMIRRQNSLNDATDPSDAIDDALKSFNSLEENQEI